MGGGVIDLAMKRSICDRHMRLERATEELDILRDEMAAVQQNTYEKASAVADLVAELHGILALPPDQRPALDSGAAEGRYALRRNSDSVVRGLLAMCRREIEAFNARVRCGDETLRAWKLVDFHTNFDISCFSHCLN